MGEWPEATEAALCATYAPRDPVREYYKGKLSLRALRVLVQGLPPDSAMHRADPKSGGWITADHLIASAVDLLHTLVEMTAAINTADDNPEPFQIPDPIERPGSAERRAVQAREAAERKAHRIAASRNLINQLVPPERR